MATTLQQQLAAIAAKSTHQLDLKAQKAGHSKSLLFEPREAASQNFDTIFQICNEGFEDLCQLDGRFVPFGKNLFSEQSKNEDRTQMSAQENKELDAVIERFFCLLGGRLLLKPALKAAEWLVRRFRTHEYNSEIMLYTFLPYHSSQIFKILLAILPEEIAPNFRFLHPYIASRQCPPRHAIIAATVSNATFFTAFNHYVLLVAKLRYQSALLMGFWASVSAQGINGMIDATRSGKETIRRQKEEDLLLRVLPILQAALNVKNVPELYLGSCMIMTIVATRISPQDKVLNAMLEAVSASWTDQTVGDGFTCLAVLADQKTNLSFSNSITHNILLVENPAKALLEASQACRIDKLAAGLCLSATRALHTKLKVRAFSFLIDILKSDLLTDWQLIKVTEEIERTMQNFFHDQQNQYTDDGRILKEALLLVNERMEDRAKPRTTPKASSKHTLTSPTQDLLEERFSSLSQPTIDLATLPPAQSQSLSFLDPISRQFAQEYLLAFQQLSVHGRDSEAFLDLSSLKRSEPIERPNFLSFFALVWTSEASTSVRSKALDIVRISLDEMSKSSDALADLQGLLPYVVVALADDHRTIRTAAAAVLQAIHSFLKNNAGKESYKDEISVWAKDSIYGSSSTEVSWLTSTDHLKTLEEALLPMLSDCLIDSDHITQALRETLSAPHVQDERKGLKTSLRTSLSAFLVSHACLSPALNVQVRILNILNGVGKAASSARAKFLIPYIHETVHALNSAPLSQEKELLLQALLSNVTHRSVEEVQLLKSLAIEKSRQTKVADISFQQLRHLWHSMQEPSQIDLADWLLMLSMKGNSAENVQTEAMDMLRNIPLSSSVLVHLTESLPAASSLQSQPSSAKKQRTTRPSEISRSEGIDKHKLDIAVRQITLVLELIEASRAEEHPQLLRGLFYLLSELHHYKLLVGSELAYLQGSLINSLLAVVDGLRKSSNKNVDRSVVRADLIVECVRTTSSTQVHHAALLLMSSLASWAPDLVLHSVMPLFTFMSSTILKQSDDYSAHVTEQTVARIIPPLAASLKKSGKDLISGAADLLLSFTAAFEHIPVHRRDALFSHLVQTLGAEEALFAIMAMLVERYQDDPKIPQFVADLMAKSSNAIQLRAIRQYLDLVFDSLKSKRTLSDVILAFGDKNRDEAKQATSNLLNGLAEIVSRNGLPKSLAKELKRGGDIAEQLRVLYSELLEKTMHLALQYKSDETLHLSTDQVLDALLRLMPTRDFIDSSAKLMQGGTDEIRQQVFRSLEQRASTAKRGDSTLRTVFIEVLPNCTWFISKDQPAETRHAAIACIDQISEKFGKTDRDAIAAAASVIAGDAALCCDNQNVRVISILCLASMVEVLEAEFIPLVPKTMGKVLEYLENISTSRPDQQLFSASFTFAGNLLDHVHGMMSGQYLDRMLVIAAKCVATSEAQARTARQFCEQSARQVSLQQCLESLQRTWSDIVGRHAPAEAQLYLELLQHTVKHNAKATIISNAQSLFSLLLLAFDLRGKYNCFDSEHSYDLGQLERIFSLVNEVAMDIVLKLNDATLRPFFTRFVEWATVRSSQSSADEMWLRATSLYSFSLVFFEQLKSLVTGYSSYVLDNASLLLQTLSTDKPQQETLLLVVVRALASSFRHDQDGFWQSPAHFDAVARPLLGLLPRAKASSLETDVIPAIRDLAAAVGSPDHYKTMNSAIMSYMRHENGEVRLAAVKCERAITEKLNIDWLAMLPEMLPFINELQEDEDEVVERETIRWMHQMEAITGQSIQDMLR